MEDTSVSFSLSALFAAAAAMVTAVASFFIRAWINGVNAKLKDVEDELENRATVAALNGLSSRVHDIEKEMVRKEDLSRLEDKWDIKFDKMDTKLDRVITMLAGK